MNMKKFAVMILALMLMATAALADGPVLLMEMPQDVQMVEDVMFDDGDFVQTYQLGGGASVHLLRYAAFDMTIDELIASEWDGAQNVAAMAISSVGGHPAMGVTLSSVHDGAGMVEVTIIMVDYGAGKLVFEAVVPQGNAQAAASVKQMIATMDVLSDGAAGSDEAEVG